ncbi:AAA family ATPase [Desulfomarina sp.]
MENNSEQSNQSIFPVTYEDDYFFSGGGRGLLLDEMGQAVIQGIPLLVLTGDEGSGKTVICGKLREQVKGDCQVVFFPRTVESFEDVIRIIATAVGISSRKITDGGSLRDLLQAIAGLLLEENRKLLIIFDEAENIYLATLERIRKMLGQMTEAGVHLYVLFSGRPSFIENFDQLVICDFKAVEEKQFRLEPLSPEETESFVSERLSLMAKDLSAKEPGEDVIERIIEISAGNFRMVKKLLQELVAPQGHDTSFMVLLDTVATDEEEPAARWKWPSFSMKRVGEDFSLKSLLPWFSGIICLLVVLFFVLRASNNESETIHPLRAQGKPSSLDRMAQPQKAKETPAAAEKPSEVGFLNKQEKPVAEVRQAEKIAVTMAAGKPDNSRQSLPGGLKGGEKKESKPVQSVIIRPVEKIDEVRRETVPENKAEGKTTTRPSHTVLQKEPVIELYPSPYIKRKAGREIEAGKGIIKVRPRTEVRRTGENDTGQTTEQLYLSRLAAGNLWRSGSRDNMYTIQLMALTARDAENNFKQMLEQADYRKVAHNFFIFRKKSRPRTLLVFYGEYSTIAEARSMRKSIPRFLQKHKPYAISIKGAIAKVRK